VPGSDVPAHDVPGSAAPVSSLEEFARAVGPEGPVTVTGAGTRGGPVPGVRAVTAPAGITWIEPEEMTACCGAATPVAELVAALAPHGQTVPLPQGGTVGGALSLGASGIRRLGDGPVRDAVLQLRYVSAAGELVKAGGPTVKNVSGFDLCRLLVGSRGTLGFIGDVILRTRPLPRSSQWYVGDGDPWELLRSLYRPTAVLWDGGRTWVLLEGVSTDRAVEAQRHGLVACDGPVDLPVGGRWSLPPSALPTLRDAEPGSFVAEIGVGIVHRHEPPPSAVPTPPIAALHRRIKQAFDPSDRLNPGRSVLDP
jgi:FAD/FMN-containing dehydrogenase